MNFLFGLMRQLTELLLWPFDLFPPWLGLTLFSVVSGAGMLWVFGKTTPQRHLEKARDRMLACVYEIRLYFDSPRRVLSAQARLLWHSLVYTACMLPAFVVLGLPLTLVYLHLEARYAYEPVPIEAPVLVKVALDEGVDGRAVGPGELPEAVAVTAPALYIEDEDVVYLRVEVAEGGSHVLPIEVDGTTVEKRIDAGARTVLSPERASGWALLYTFTDEAPIDPSAGVSWISVAQPLAVQEWAWLEMPWWLFWLVLATVTAFALRRPMNVVL